MNITVFKNFSKRRNSTKRPAMETGTTLIAQLKEMTSVENPSFIIRRTEDFESVNYVYALNHYYTVSDTVILDNDRIELRCVQDVLATFKDEILNTSQYIAYASSNYDNMMFDARCAMTGEVKFNTRLTDVPNSSTTGMYILTVLNDALNETFTSTYLVTPSNLGILANELMDTEIDWANFFHASFDYINAIVTCRWIPFTFTETELYNTHYEFIYIGTKSTDARGIRLDANAYFRFKSSFEIPFEYNDFRKLSPYTELSLYIPYYGVVNIPSTYFANSTRNSLWYWYSLDLFTGDVSITLDNVNRDNAGTYQLLNFNVGVDVPIAQMRTNIGGIMSDIGTGVGSVASIFAGNYVGGTVGAVSSMVNLGMDSQTPLTSVKGSIQGRSMTRIETRIALNVKTKLTKNPNEYASVIGRPIAEPRQIGSFISGSYVQTENASIDIAGRNVDNEQINGLLDSGIFIE